MSEKLVMAKTNKFGDPQYVESDCQSESIELESLPVEGFWSVKNPSDKLSELLIRQFGAVLRRYDDALFILSNKAAQNIKEEGHGYGSAVVVSFDYKDNTYYLFVTDNKHYVQTCQGAVESGEDQLQCAIRELKEELMIVAGAHEFRYAGYWSFCDTNELIDYTRVSSTKVFHLHLPFERVAHLFPEGLVANIECVKSTDLSFYLNEIQFVLAVRKDVLHSAPEKLNQIKIKKKNRQGDLEDVPCSFSGHHREFVSRLAGFPEKYDVSYLQTFAVLS